jgi:DNA modification methylase
VTDWNTITDVGPYELNGVIHGDCLAVLPGLPASCVDLVCTSPPFNAGIDYGPGICDWRPWGEYYAWLEEVLRQLYRVLKPGGVLALDLPKEVRLTPPEIEAGGQRVEKVGTRVDSICLDLGYLPRESVVWAKGGEGLPIARTSRIGSDNNIYLRHVCHLILLYSKERYYYDGGTGRRGRLDVPWTDETKDVWWIPPARSNGHPCPFPEEVPRRLVDLFTRPRPERSFVPLVLDPFAGSGMTGVVARRMGRNFVGVELNEVWAAEGTAQVAATRPVISSPVTAGMSKDGAVLRLPLSAIVVDARVNVREGLDEATVERYAAIFDSLPPVVVFSTPQGYLLASGFHRLEAARRLGRAEVAAVVREGSRAEAEEFAILDNVSHGRPYTRAEQRRAVERMLSLHPERSDNWLAQDLGVSDHTVRSVREELESTSQIAKLDRLLGKDGKERPRSASPPVGQDDTAEEPQGGPPDFIDADAIDETTAPGAPALRSGRGGEMALPAGEQGDALPAPGRPARSTAPRCWTGPRITTGRASRPSSPMSPTAWSSWAASGMRRTRAASAAGTTTPRWGEIRRSAGCPARLPSTTPAWACSGGIVRPWRVRSALAPPATATGSGCGPATARAAAPARAGKGLRRGGTWGPTLSTSPG